MLPISLRLITTLTFLGLLVQGDPALGQPNVVAFLTDDQGWGDLSLHGNTNLDTPNIDSLARDGASLENFYVCAVCAPTRAEFLTARYHQRAGVSGVSEGQGRLNPDETTIADLFKTAGYATGVFGKWHNGTQSPYHPNDRGFDEFYGFTSGHWGHYFSPPLDHNRERVKGKGYLPDDLTDHALTFIEKHRAEPFFCYVPYNTPHSPFYIGDNFFEKFAELATGDEKSRPRKGRPPGDASRPRDVRKYRLECGPDSRETRRSGPLRQHHRRLLFGQRTEFLPVERRYERQEGRHRRRRSALPFPHSLARQDPRRAPGTPGDGRH